MVGTSFWGGVFMGHSLIYFGCAGGDDVVAITLDVWHAW